MWAGLHPRNHFIGRVLVDALTSVHLKNGPPRSRSLSALCLKIARCSKRAPSLNIWPSSNIEPTLSQISEETLESLKLRERNSRASNSTQSQTTRGASPEWRHATRTRGIPSSHTDHFNLKASIKQPLKWLNRVVFISKVKILEFSS